MLNEKDAVSVLIVSSGKKAVDYFSEVLPSAQFNPVISVGTAGEAKRLLVEQSFDIVVVNTPLSDEFGVEFAIDTAQNTSSGVLIFVKAENYEQVAYKTEEFGIFTLARPTNRQTLFQTVHMLAASRNRLKAFEQKAETLEAKMNEIRLVNRAKLLLMESLKMSEADAHRYIEKTAMDKCVKKTAVAENIINTYG